MVSKVQKKALKKLFYTNKIHRRECHLFDFNPRTKRALRKKGLIVRNPTGWMSGYTFTDSGFALAERLFGTVEEVNKARKSDRLAELKKEFAKKALEDATARELADLTGYNMITVYADYDVEEKLYLRYINVHQYLFEIDIATIKVSIRGSGVTLTPAEFKAATAAVEEILEWLS